MNETPAGTLSAVLEREIPYPPEKVWRALTQPRLIEEWLMKNDFKPEVGHCFNLRADWGAVSCRVLAAEPNKSAFLHVGCPRSQERRQLDTHPRECGDPPSPGTVGLPAGSSAVLPRRQGRVAEVPCEPGAGLGADGLKPDAKTLS